jgi:hypothetical protein
MTLVLMVVWPPVLNEEGGALAKTIETGLEGDEPPHAQREATARTEREGIKTLRLICGLSSLLHRFRSGCIVLPLDSK